MPMYTLPSVAALGPVPRDGVEPARSSQSKSPSIDMSHDCGDPSSLSKPQDHSETRGPERREHARSLRRMQLDINSDDDQYSNLTLSRGGGGGGR